MKDIERLNMHIAWSALTKKEQITLHKLLSKAHLAYDEEIKSKKYRIYYKHESTGTIKETTYVFDTIIEAGSKCAWLNEETMAGAFGKYYYEEQTNDTRN